MIIIDLAIIALKKHFGAVYLKKKECCSTLSVFNTCSKKVGSVNLIISANRISYKPWRLNIFLWIGNAGKLQLTQSCTWEQYLIVIVFTVINCFSYSCTYLLCISYSWIMFGNTNQNDPWTTRHLDIEL